jgi:hypothetical protein
MQDVREIGELYRHLAAVADKYSNVAAINRLGTLGLTGPEADKLRRESAVWEQAARQIRNLGKDIEADVAHSDELQEASNLGKDIEADVAHSDELQEAIATGSRPTFVSLMAQAFPDRVAKRRVA